MSQPAADIRVSRVPEPAAPEPTRSSGQALGPGSAEVLMSSSLPPIVDLVADLHLAKLTDTERSVFVELLLRGLSSGLDLAQLAIAAGGTDLAAATGYRRESCCRALTSLVAKRLLVRLPGARQNAPDYYRVVLDRRLWSCGFKRKPIARRDLAVGTLSADGSPPRSTRPGLLLVDPASTARRGRR